MNTSDDKNRCLYEDRRTRAEITGEDGVMSVACIGCGVNFGSDFDPPRELADWECEKFVAEHSGGKCTVAWGLVSREWIPRNINLPPRPPIKIAVPQNASRCTDG